MAGIWLGPLVAPAQSAAPDSIVYLISPTSQLEVRTGKAGLFGFAGHVHRIRAHAFFGRVVYYPATPAASHVEIVVPADSLEVLTPPDTAEIRKVTAAMRTDVLDVAHYPEIRFVSKTVAPSTAGLRIVGELTLVGRTREVPAEVSLEVGGDTLRVATTFTVNQTDFGIRPYRGGPAGTVRVADRVTFEVHVTAVREGAP
jgi:polyisoprenoid-binding protein YceI